MAYSKKAQLLPTEDILLSNGTVQCLLCCEPTQVCAVSQCNHSDVCAICCLRMRVLYNQKMCCMCKVVAV